MYQLVATFPLNFEGAAILPCCTHKRRLSCKPRCLILTFGCRFSTCTSTSLYRKFNTDLLTSSSNRQFNHKFNIFEEIWHNWFFIDISLIMIGGQILVVFIGRRAFAVTRPNGAQWGISIAPGRYPFLSALLSS